MRREKFERAESIYCSSTLKRFAQIKLKMVRYLPANRRLSSNLSADSANNNSSNKGPDEIEEPELYRLVRARNGREVDWTSIRLRLEHLRDVIGVGVEESSKNVLVVESARSELLWSHPLTGVTSLHVICCWRPPPSVVDLYVRICPESVWSRSHNGSTALHSACGNGATAEVVRSILNASESCDSSRLDYSKSTGASINSHMRRRQEEVVSHRDKKLKSPLTSEDDKSRGGSTASAFALLRTVDRNWTALHCACHGSGMEASLPVLRLLLNAAPEAVVVADHDLPELGRTPLDVLCGNYELLARRYVQQAEDEQRRAAAGNDDGQVQANAAAAAAPEEIMSEETMEVDIGDGNEHDLRDDDEDDDSVLPWRDLVPNESLRHFWTKACLLVRTAATAVGAEKSPSSYSKRGFAQGHFQERRTVSTSTRRPRKRTPIVHAALSLPASSPCPPTLLRLALLSFPRQFAVADSRGDLPLHVACRNPDAAMRPLTRPRRVSGTGGGGTDGRQSFAATSGSDDSVCCAGTTALDVLLRDLPVAAAVPSDCDGLLPLQIIAREAAVASNNTESKASANEKRMALAARKVLFADPSSAASCLANNNGNNSNDGCCANKLFPRVLRLLSDPDVAARAGVVEGSVYPEVGRSIYGETVGAVSYSSLLGNVFVVLQSKPDLLLGATAGTC